MSKNEWYLHVAFGWEREFYRSYLTYTSQITNGKIAVWAYRKKREIKVKKMTGTA